MVGQDVVGIGAEAVGVGVDERARQAGDGVQQVVLGVEGDLVCLYGAKVRS
jgi:hypothetical protein